MLARAGRGRVIKLDLRRRDRFKRSSLRPQAAVIEAGLPAIAHDARACAALKLASPAHCQTTRPIGNTEPPQPAPSSSAIAPDADVLPLASGAYVLTPCPKCERTAVGPYGPTLRRPRAYLDTERRKCKAAAGIFKPLPEAGSLGPNSIQSRPAETRVDVGQADGGQPGRDAPRSIWPYSYPSMFLNFNPPCAHLRPLRNPHGQHAILEVRLDLVRFQLATELEATPIHTRADVRIQGLRLLRQIELHLAFNDEALVLHPHAQPLFGDARQIRLQRDAVPILVNVHGRSDYDGGL